MDKDLSDAKGPHAFFLYTASPILYGKYQQKVSPVPLTVRPGAIMPERGEGCLSPIPRRKDWKMILKAVVVGLAVTLALISIFGYLLQAPLPPGDVFG
jgi:hypothetical protein